MHCIDDIPINGISVIYYRSTQVGMQGGWKVQETVMTPDIKGYPIYDGDLFDPAVLADSGPAFREIRELGDVVWSPRLRMFIVGRYHDVQAGLRANDVLISGEGVSVNVALQTDPNFKAPAGVLNMDGDEHARRKQLLMKPLMPRALQAIKDRVVAEADEIVRSLANGQAFDAMPTLASHLPTRIVSQLVGLNDAGSERLLRWSIAAFDGFGPPDNPRSQAALPDLFDFLKYGAVLSRDSIVPEGWAAGLFDAADRGEISLDTARLMVFDYATPSLDTTIMATGEMLWRLATAEGAFDAVRENPDLIPSVVYEAVRLSCPIRGFTRFVTQDFAFSERTVPAGSWIWLLNASGNRDERHYPDPDRFDVARNPRDQLGWGQGVHLCAGMHLARLEMETLLATLVRSVRKIEAGEPTRLINNGLQGFRHLPLALHPL